MILHIARFFGIAVIPRGTDRAIIDGYAVGRADRYRTLAVERYANAIGVDLEQAAVRWGK